MVSIQSYGCFCSDNGLKRFTSKAGRGFVKCSKSTCTLFCPEESYNEIIAAYESKIAEKFKPNKFPLCNYDETTSLWVSHSSANPGRPYFRCQDTDLEDKCDFFQWADDLCKKKKRKPTKKVSESKEEPEAKNFKRVQVLSSSDEENTQAN